MLYVEQLQYFLVSSLHSFPASFANVEKRVSITASQPISVEATEARAG